MQKINRILITGGTGFLGRNICRSLVENKMEVCLLVRKTSNVDLINDFLKSVKVVVIGSDKWRNEVFSWNADCFLHFATSYGRKNESIVDINLSNVVFPLELLKIAEEMKTPPLFINTDTSLPRDVNTYSRSKKYFLECLRNSEKLPRMVNIILESFYGPGDGQFMSIMANKIKQNVDEIDLTLGTQKRDYLFYKDVISAYMKIIEVSQKQSKRYEEYELGSGEAYTIKSIIKIMLEESGNTMTQINWGAVKYRENEVMYSVANISKIRSLGWSPQISIEDGVKELIK